jgi:xylulokinase
MQMTAKCVLGLDLGTSSVKAVVLSETGDLLFAGQRAYPTTFPAAGWAEQDPSQWWEAAVELVHEMLQCLFGARIAALAISCQAPTLVALDEAGRVLRPAIIWMDRRAEPFTEKARRLAGLPWADAFFLLPKLLWMQQHEPAVLQRVHQVLQANGYLVYRLTGRCSMDLTHAALTLLCRGTDTPDWNQELIRESGLPAGIWPPLKTPVEVVGSLSTAASQISGLPAGIPVMAGAIDAVTAALECGVVEPDTSVEMTGTSSVFAAYAEFADQQEIARQTRLVVVHHAIRGASLVLGPTVAGGGSIKWLCEHIGIGEKWAAPVLHQDVFTLLSWQAANAPAGSHGVFFLPYLYGERAPLWQANACGAFVGLTLQTTHADLIRSVFEGTAFALCHNLEHARLLNLKIKGIRVSGEGAHNHVWNQIKADVCGLPVVTNARSYGSAFGAALLAGVGAGLWSDLAAISRQVFKAGVACQPDRERHRFYSRLFQVYKQLSTDLKGSFELLAPLRTEG